MRKQILWLMVLAVLITGGCRSRYEIDTTHEIKPIHITLDVNLKVDRELDNFFGDIDDAAATQ